VRALWKPSLDGAMEIPITRMDWRSHYDPVSSGGGRLYVNRGAFIDDVAMFDHALFRLTAAEAAIMDPQQRVSLEVTHTALQQSDVLALAAAVFCCYPRNTKKKPAC